MIDQRIRLDHLEAFAKDSDDPHLSAWRNYWKRVGQDDRGPLRYELRQRQGEGDVDRVGTLNHQGRSLKR